MIVHDRSQYEKQGFQSKIFENRKIGIFEILIFQKFWKFSIGILVFSIFRFFEIFDRKKFSSQISKSIFSNIDQKISTWLDPGESWASPLSNAPKIIANGALTPKFWHQTSATQNFSFALENVPLAGLGTPSLVYGLTCGFGCASQRRRKTTKSANRYGKFVDNFFFPQVKSLKN